MLVQSVSFFPLILKHKQMSRSLFVSPDQKNRVILTIFLWFESHKPLGHTSTVKLICIEHTRV